MEEGLMHIYQNWGDSDCHEEVREKRYAKKLNPGDPIPLWPCGKEQQRLDEICTMCANNLFEIDKPECPICGGESIEPGSIITSFSTGPSWEGFNYRCRNCNRVFISQRNFFGS